MADRELTLVKLGGSLITDKRREAHARVETIECLASELASVLPELDRGVVLGHGSGSFGHVAAKNAGLENGLGDGPALGAAAVLAQAATLHRLVMGALVGAGVPAWTWAASSAMTADRGRPVSADVEALVLAVGAGFVPVTFGDVVADRSRRASICSTESIFTELVVRLRGRGLAVRRLLWLGETRGIYDQAGATVPRVDAGNVGAVREMVGGAAGTDVTGGMLLRLETARALARQGVESWIVDGREEGVLAAGLRGEELPGTHVVP